MTEGLKSLALIYFNFAQLQEKSLRLACGNPPPFTREAMSKMTEGLKGIALFIQIPYNSAKSLRLT